MAEPSLSVVSASSAIRKTVCPKCDKPISINGAHKCSRCDELVALGPDAETAEETLLRREGLGHLGRIAEYIYKLTTT